MWVPNNVKSKAKQPQKPVPKELFNAVTTCVLKEVGRQSPPEQSRRPLAELPHSAMSMAKAVLTI